MAVAFNRFSHWLWGRKENNIPNSSLSSSPEFPSGYREPDSVMFPSVGNPRTSSSSRRIRKKWQSRGERRIDKECDVVLVPSDGGCMSGSDSDDSDWSIGWLEPHSSDFKSLGDSESSFAVIVPCYRHRQPEKASSSTNHILGVGDLMDENLSDGRSFVEQWLSPLQNS